MFFWAGSHMNCHCSWPDWKWPSPSMGRCYMCVLSQEWRHQSIPSLQCLLQAYREAPQLSVRTWRVKSAEHSYANQVCNWHCLCNYQCNPPLSTTSRKERRVRWESSHLEITQKSGPGARSTIRWKQFLKGKSAEQIILHFMHHHYYEGAALDLNFYNQQNLSQYVFSVYWSCLKFFKWISLANLVEKSWWSGFKTMSIWK